MIHSKLTQHKGYARLTSCEKVTDDGRWTPSDGKSSHCIWQGELKKNNNKKTDKNVHTIRILTKTFY